MSKLKELQIELSELIPDAGDLATLLRLYSEVSHGSSSHKRSEIAKTIIDLRSIYGSNLDKAIYVLLQLEAKPTAVNHQPLSDNPVF